MVIIDTNALAYLLIEGEHTAAAQELRRKEPDWRSETFILVEFSNVLARYIIARSLRLDIAQGLLVEASSLFMNKLARVSHSYALEVAAKFQVTAYDARFLALAQQARLKLVTEDIKLRAAAPELTQSISEALLAA